MLLAASFSFRTELIGGYHKVTGKGCLTEVQTVEKMLAEGKASQCIPLS